MVHGVAAFLFVFSSLEELQVHLLTLLWPAFLASCGLSELVISFWFLPLKRFVVLHFAAFFTFYGCLFQGSSYLHFFITLFLPNVASAWIYQCFLKSKDDCLIAGLGMFGNWASWWCSTCVKLIFRKLVKFLMQPIVKSCCKQKFYLFL